MTMIKKIYTIQLILFATLFLTLPTVVCLAAAEALSARQVIEAEDARDDGDTEMSNLTMILIDKNDRQRVRNIKSFRKDYGEDTKSVRFFIEPADVRDTAYLSYDWDDRAKTDDAWLYLPALRKVKRVSASEKSDAFMGSDFTYSDIDDIETDDWEYKFVKENVKVDGHDCWLIEGKPKPELRKKVLKETGYLKRQIWVRKDNFYAVQGKFWVEKGKKIKYLKIKDLRLVDGIWTAHEMQMVTTKKGRLEHRSVIRFHGVTYNQTIADSRFSTQAIARGW
jgi:outer membrane lipoprotein-sorting protein